jgi:hypothetical protein
MASTEFPKPTLKFPSTSAPLCLLSTFLPLSYCSPNDRNGDAQHPQRPYSLAASPASLGLLPNRSFNESD